MSSTTAPHEPAAAIVTKGPTTPTQSEPQRQSRVSVSGHDAGTAPTPSSFDGLCGDGGASSDCFQNVVFGGVTADGRIVAAYWNGASEPVVYIDPATGMPSVAGVLGDLRWWQDQLIYDAVRNVVYANGQDASMHPYLYALPLSVDGGASTRVDLGGSMDSPCSVSCGPQNRIFGGIDSAGKIVGAYGTGSAQALTLFDPATGAGSFVANLGTLDQWDGQLLYDATHHVAYAAGDDSAQQFNVYTLSLGTLALTTVPFASPTALPCEADAGCIPVNGAIAGPTSDGHILVAYWTGSAEAVALADPLTGSSTLAGYFTGLRSWSDQLAYDAARGMLYAWGQDAGGAWRLYSLSVGT